MVDLAECGSGLNTLLAITNTSSETVLAHLTLWTDQAVGALNFDIYLTGYDVYSVSLAGILCDGNIRPSGFGVSNHGSLSGPAASFPGCSESATPGDPPNYPNPAISPAFKDHLQAWLTGQPSPATATCAGTAYGDGVARGFVTIDVSQTCSVNFASEAPYFDEVVATQNVLLGEYLFVGGAGGAMAALPAVGLEAAAGEFDPGDHTFYGRYVDGDGSDDREPTGSRFAARFLGAGPTSATTWHIYRETPETAFDAATGWSCIDGPPWAPLDDASITFFDEEENVVTADVALAGGSHAYDVTTDVANPYTDGWAVVDLAHDGLSVYGDGVAQGWVTAFLQNAQGGLAGGFDGVVMNDICEINLSRLFVDGFESGDTSLWSATVP
jgi:hypothetical protein